jgi:hypothetical protein
LLLYIEEFVKRPANDSHIGDINNDASCLTHNRIRKVSLNTILEANPVSVVDGPDQPLIDLLFPISGIVFYLFMIEIMPSDIWFFLFF